MLHWVTIVIRSLSLLNYVKDGFAVHVFSFMVSPTKLLVNDVALTPSFDIFALC